MPLEVKRVYQDAPNPPEPRTFTRDEAHARPGVYRKIHDAGERVIVLDASGYGIFLDSEGDFMPLALGFGPSAAYVQCNEPVTVTFCNVPE